MSPTSAEKVTDDTGDATSCSYVRVVSICDFLRWDDLYAIVPERFNTNSTGWDDVTVNVTQNNSYSWVRKKEQNVWLSNWLLGSGLLSPFQPYNTLIWMRFGMLTSFASRWQHDITRQKVKRQKVTIHWGSTLKRKQRKGAQDMK